MRETSQNHQDCSLSTRRTCAAIRFPGSSPPRRSTFQPFRLLSASTWRWGPAALCCQCSPRSLQTTNTQREYTCLVFLLHNYDTFILPRNHIVNIHFKIHHVLPNHMSSWCVPKLNDRMGMFITVPTLFMFGLLEISPYTIASPVPHVMNSLIFAAMLADKSRASTNRRS